MKRRILSMALALVMVFMLLPTAAFAEGGGNDLVLKKTGNTPAVVGTDYTYENGALTISGSGPYTLSMVEGKEKTDHCVVINNTSGTSLTLSNVNIDTSKIEGTAAFLIVSGAGAVTLTLSGENSLTSGENHAGLEKNNEAMLTISGIGSLNAKGGLDGAGIGGGEYGKGSSITISGGTVTATGGDDAAGIGGGLNGEGSSISITGGTVIATGGLVTPGIGGGYNADSSDITISGGTVTATGGAGLNSIKAGVAIGGGNGYGMRNKIIPAEGYIFTIVEKPDFNGKAETDISKWTDNKLTITFAKKPGLVLTHDEEEVLTDDDYTYEDGVMTIKGKGPYTLNMGEDMTSTSDCVVVKNVDDLKLTLNNVNIDTSSNEDTAAFLMSDDAQRVNLTLKGTNYLSSGENCAGLQKGGFESVLYIEGEGTLIAAGGRGAAGIGGGNGRTGGFISISSGEVTATGGEGGAGIGGGNCSYGCDIIVSGGTVFAQGGKGACAIGSGAEYEGVDNSGNKIVPADGATFVVPERSIFEANVETDISAWKDNKLTITFPMNTDLILTRDDAEVLKKTDYSYKDGVLTIKGAGPYTLRMADRVKGSTTDTVKITSSVTGGLALTIEDINIDVSEIETTAAFTISQVAGDVTLTLMGTNTLKSGKNSAGLQKENDSYLTIKGSGSLTAEGGQDAAGIGGGVYKGGRYISINSGSVTAKGGENGAGIGGAKYGSCGYINIKGGTVIATGGEGAAGIGGGNDNSGYSIEVSGGTVTATGGKNGAGIGGGYNSTGSSIAISGGTVTATGGKNGAGIGGGHKKAGYNIAISGGEVTAQGGTDAFAIGSGAEYEGANNSGNKIVPTDGATFVVPEHLNFEDDVETDISDWTDNKLTIRFIGVPANPTIDPNGGLFIHTLGVNITCDEDAVIYYTTDGSAPSQENGVLYTGEITLMTDTTIKAIAVNETKCSSVVTAVFEVDSDPTHTLVRHEAKAPTCTEKGWKEYITCTVCDYTDYEEIPALGHDLVYHEGKAATYTEVGWYSYDTCSRCDYTTYMEIAKLVPTSGGGGYTPSYDITAPAAEHGSVSLGKNNAQPGDTVTITVTPDQGYTLETLTVIDENGKEIELTEKDGKYTFKMPSGKVEIKAAFMEDNTMLNFFADVPVDAYYYDAVLWATANEITSGTSATTFSPNAPCTRAQVVTFLWRAAGSPVVNYAMPFTDVPADAYYTEAVRWAVSEGITGGTSATTFSPDGTCTRGQIVAFLYRFAGNPAVSGGSAFSDVAADTYYTNAVKWAAENGVTSGTGAATFSPANDCTRAQIVTFLYRYFVK